MKEYCRYEILLPLQFNDGESVPEELIADTQRGIRKRFDAAPQDPEPVKCQWKHNGQVFREKLARIWVAVEDTPENRQFFVEFKERLKERFQQLDIWLSKHPIELL